MSKYCRIEITRGRVHMKKITTGISLLLLILFITACNNESVDEPDTETAGNEEVDPSNEAEDSDSAEQDLPADDGAEDSEESDEEVTEETPDETEVSYQVNQNNWAVEPIEEGIDEKVVLLTIDDAPDGQALEMAQTLKSLEVPAIFFVNGHFLATDEKHDILKDIHDMGFAIGNHTFNHPNLQDISGEEQRQQLVDLNDLIESIIGERPQFFRAPFGANTDESLAIAEEENMVVMNWSYGYDWEKDYQDATNLADIMVNTEFLRDGANLLMHDRTWTNEALPDIVSGLREKGYSFVDPDAIKKVD